MSENKIVCNKLSSVDSSNTTQLIPMKKLKEIADEYSLNITSLKFAQKLDELDELSSFRDQFIIPKNKNVVGFEGTESEGDSECLYFSGQSLGLCPKKSYQNVSKVLDNWSSKGTFTHTEGYLPAAFCDLPPKTKMAQLVGADENEIAIMNGLTVNMHLLFIHFYKPNAQRFKIIMEENAFPSDLYAVKSQIELHGLDPAKCLILLKNREGEKVLREEDIEEIIEQNATSTAILWLPGLHYYTGQWLDIPRLVSYAKSHGILAGVDLAHAVGNIQLRLSEWNVDFACWCSYKYLCSGPGGLGAIYVNKRFTSPTEPGKPLPLPRLRGWWGNDTETKFLMKPDFSPKEGADSFKLSNPPPLLAATLMSSLEIFSEATMDRIKKKQFLITGYLEYLMQLNFSNSITMITPSNPSKRGSQLSFEFSFPIENIQKNLEKRGIVCDIRKPNAMRVTPVVLYNRFEDVHQFVEALQQILNAEKSI